MPHGPFLAPPPKKKTKNKKKTFLFPLTNYSGEMRVAMCHYSHKMDMAAALRHIAHSPRVLPVSYESLSSTSHKKRTQTANKARVKQRAREEDDGEGPPDERGLLEGIF